MAALLEARGVTKRFGGLIALNKVDFILEEGRIASIIGPNGAGKTTFFNVFTGLYVPEEGTVSFRGAPLLGLRSDQITALGVCRTFQNIRLFRNMTAVENVLVGMHARVGPGLGSARARNQRLNTDAQAPAAAARDRGVAGAAEVDARGGGRPCLRCGTFTSPTERSAPCAASPSRCARARSSPSSAATVRGRPRPSAPSPGSCTRAKAISSSRVSRSSASPLMPSCTGA